jgi:AraC-like DNA-binding protein
VRDGRATHKIPIVHFSGIVSARSGSTVPNTQQIAAGVRIPWACAVLNVCQGMLSYTLDGDPGCVDAIADRLRAELPPPQTVTESVYVGHQLVAILEGIGEALHTQFHFRFVRGDCGLRPDHLYTRLMPGPRLTAGEVIAVWQALFRRWFDEHHEYPPALRAKMLLQRRFSDPWTVTSLAQAIGTSRSTLLADFQEAFGMRPAEYVTRLRLREGLRRFRDPKLDALEAVNSVGYKSLAKFAARQRRYTSQTPSRIRRMSAGDFEALLNERLRLHVH